jgi:hypothetical protein
LATVSFLFTDYLEMKNLFRSASVILIIASLFTSGCETPEGNAALGAITGATIGGIAKKGWTGAATGAAIGAGAGYLGGQAIKRERQAQQSAYGTAYPGRNTAFIPTGRPTNRYGYVRSPYYPNNLIDVRGVPSGARVIDPSTEKVFINP